jgi:peroxiredoxin (alkyl hydroperoxide reductase subunit C)
MSTLKQRFIWYAAALLMITAVSAGQTLAQETPSKSMLYDPGQLKPVDSVLKVKVGDPAPAFALPSLSGETISLDQYRGARHVVISFVPAAWTPVCSDQWPGYNIAKGIFDQYDAVLLGITVDNLPTLHAWTRQMGDLWFPVLSDFWPHGAVAQRFGVLRTDGTAERALFVIDKAGVIRFISVSDINRRPNLKEIVDALKAIQPPVTE